MVEDDCEVELVGHIVSRSPRLQRWNADLLALVDRVGGEADVTAVSLLDTVDVELLLGTGDGIVLEAGVNRPFAWLWNVRT